MTCFTVCRHYFISLLPLLSLLSSSLSSFRILLSSLSSLSSLPLILSSSPLLSLLFLNISSLSSHPLILSSSHPHTATPQEECLRPCLVCDCRPALNARLNCAAGGGYEGYDTEFKFLDMENVWTSQQRGEEGRVFFVFFVCLLVVLSSFLICF